MKKLTSIFVVLFALSIGSIFANNSPEVMEHKEALYSITVEYYDTLQEARIVYVCPETLFDQGVAVKAVKDRAIQLCKEKGFSKYSYTNPDNRRQRKDGNIRMTVYTTYILLQEPLILTPSEK